VVVRMAVLYELLAGREARPPAGPSPARAEPVAEGQAA
jgi:hypothetical protein